MIGVVLSASLLASAAGQPQSPPALSPTPGDPCPIVENEPGALAMGHAAAPGTYTAQTLLQSRWDIGAVQANWNHRPLWQSPVTGQGVRVAVIDTGVDAGHPDLQGRVVAWKDFVGDREQPYDDTGHGTHVAGIIAGGGHTQLRPDESYFLTGARGIAPDAEIIAAKAMDKDGRGDPNRIAEAILWSLEGDGERGGAHVINLSLGIAWEDPGHDDVGVLGERDSWGIPRHGSMSVVEDAIQKAHRQGAIVVVSAGNHQAGEPGRILFPGTLEEVITVGASDPTGQVAPFSNTGTRGDAKPDLVAPGVVVSTHPQQEDTRNVPRYKGLGGTSMAAPFVAGTVALLLETDATLQEQSASGDHSGNTDRVRTILTQSARPIHGAQPEEQGAGQLRVDAALQLAGGDDGPLRPAAYATPFFVAVGGYWVIRRRAGSRHRVFASKDPDEPGRPAATSPARTPPANTVRPPGLLGPHTHARKATPMLNLPRAHAGASIHVGAHGPRLVRASPPLTPTPTPTPTPRPPRLATRPRSLVSAPRPTGVPHGHARPPRPRAEAPRGEDAPRRQAQEDAPGSQEAPWE